MSLPVNALINVAQAQAQGVDGADSSIEALIGIATSLLEEYCGRPLLYAEEVEFPDLDGDPEGRSWQILGPHLRTVRRPIVAVSSVVIDGEEQTVDTVSSEVTLPLGQAPETVWLHEPWLAVGRLFRAAGWPAGYTVLQYAGGFGGPGQSGLPPGVPVVPDYLAQAAALTVAGLQNLVDRGQDLDLISERTPGGAAWTWRAGGQSAASLIPATAKMLVARLKVNHFL